MLQLRRPRFFPLLCSALLAAAPAWSAPASPPPPDDPEQQLVGAINQIEAGKLTEARDALDRLVKAQPNFRLAKLFQGELTAALTGTPVPAAQRMSDGDKRGLMDEARLRLWQDVIPPDTVPDALLQLAPQTEHALVVDLPRARLYVLENHDGVLQVVKHFYAASGKNGAGKEKAGDDRTPVGIYRVTSFVGGDQLPDFYGAGAFKTDYPNAWDRQNHRDGHGIWLHGVPRTMYSRAPRSSEGCVTLPNEDLLALKPYVQAGRTPVVFTDSLEWLPRAQVQQQREELLAQIEQWRGRWSALDTEAYLNFYAPDFTTEGMNRSAFAAHKRRVNAGKSSIQVQLSNVELYHYPGDAGLMLARFTQDYRSNNLVRSARKEQFWRREKNGQWQIVRETSG